ncbi:hypothetical protein R3W88_004158 [Solanum pinnatisectum]|uniref:Gag-pro-like protein n=1 Tax=Solanum pinnatisectum TaxID=50273 RepID=A0AAV9K8H8_9SOLN|nr:hypothetical protein R3W88_004158 [Solanum pinnatisectum]
MTSCIQKPEAGGRFELKQSMVQLLHENGQFTGLSHEDPTIYIQNLLEISDTYTPARVNEDYVRLMLCPVSLLRENSRPQGGLPGNSDPNPKKVNAVGTRIGLQLEELAPKKRNVESARKESEPKYSEFVAQKERVQPIVKSPPPFPQKFKKHKKDECFGKFLSLLKEVHINLPLVDVLQGIPRYAKYVKEIVENNRRLTEYEIVALTEECSSQIQNKLPIKLKDPNSFTVQIGLCDLGASINLMPTSLYKSCGWVVLNPLPLS